MMEGGERGRTCKEASWTGGTATCRLRRVPWAPCASAGTEPCPRRQDPSEENQDLDWTGSRRGLEGMRGAVVVVLWCALLVLGVDAQEPVAMRCYQGVSYSRVATGPMNPTVLVPKAGVATKAHYSKDELESPTVPEVVCNDTKDEIYIGCYSVCQQMHLQNMTAGTLDVPDFFIDVCRYGCATEVMINAMKRWNGGALQFDFMCGCRWDRSGTFWTDENVDYKGSCICASVHLCVRERVPVCPGVFVPVHDAADGYIISCASADVCLVVRMYVGIGLPHARQTFRMCEVLQPNVCCNIRMRSDIRSRTLTHRQTPNTGPKFCCPNCHWKTSDSPGRCPDEFKLDLKTCTPAQVRASVQA